MKNIFYHFERGFNYQKLSQTREWVLKNTFSHLNIRAPFIVEGNDIFLQK